MPAARKFIHDQKLNEIVSGDLDDIGIIVMGGLINSVLRALERIGLADVFGPPACRSWCLVSSIPWCRRKYASSLRERRLAALPTFSLDPLRRYEQTLWRQAGQTLFFAPETLRRKRELQRSRFCFCLRRRDMDSFLD